MFANLSYSQSDLITDMLDNRQLTTDPGTFNNLVKPFFKEYCTRCHGEKKQKADYAIHDIDYRIGDGKDLDRWEKALEMMRVLRFTRL